MEQLGKLEAAGIFAPEGQKDQIVVRDLLVRNVIGVDNWERKKKQDIIINLKIQQDISSAGEDDSLQKTISYSMVTKHVAEFAEAKHYKSVEGLAEGIADLCINTLGVKGITVRVEKPRALLHAASAGVEIFRSSLPDDAKASKENDHVFISNLSVRTIIGVNPWERDEKQDVIVSLIIWPQSQTSGDHVSPTHNYRTISRSLVDFLESSSFQTIEAMATSVSEILLLKSHARKVTLYIEKPSALLLAKSAGVQITREFNHAKKHALSSQSTHMAFIGLGANLGNRAKSISAAVKELGAFGQVVDTSFLYETPAAYVEDQPKFLNAVCKLNTHLGPEELLEKVKLIETAIGRTETFRWGPRVVDLDILYYDSLEHRSEKLEIPHPRLQEREFVLRPLCDIAGSLEHPSLMKTSLQLFNHLKKDSAIYKLLPVGEGGIPWGKRTLIMGILNVTPDSFSDGGKFNSEEAAVARALQIQKEGADILDIGGLSTRPGADEIPVEEEINRVVPIIKRLKATEDFRLPISIDTYRAAVARAAVEAGAILINDVTGGYGDPEMYATMAELDVAVCLMHMRGSTKTMTQLKDYENDDVVAGVKKELGERVEKALAAGVRRWNIIIDAGFGYSKKPEQSIHLLSHLQELVQPDSILYGFPILAGPSRKGFIGSVLNQPDAEQRVWGTAAACAALVASKVDILRVHDVSQMSDVIKVSDAIWRAK